MQNKLIALTVAGACCAPAAFAQTASPVTLYGVVRVNLESVEAKGGAGVPRRNRVEDRVSFFGIRGTEDLGGGLKLFFQLETPFKPDQNDTPFATRNSAVGLQGGFGSIRLGRWDTPMKQALAGPIDPFGDIGLGDVTTAFLRGGTFSQRAVNTVQWWSPNWGGIAVKAMYSANEGKTATVNPYNWGASLTYSRGPVYLAIAHEKHEESVGLTATDNVDEEGTALGGSFRAGAAKISAGYGEFKRTGATKNKGWLLGFEYTAGKNVFLASMQSSKDGGSRTATTQPKCESRAVGYRYDFTRRTSFIAEYADIDNNTAASCNFGLNPLGGVAAGMDPRGISLGFRHVF